MSMAILSVPSGFVYLCCLTVLLLTEKPGFAYMSGRASVAVESKLVPFVCRCRGAVASMEMGRTIYDEGWDLFGYTGYSPVMNAVIVVFRGTDSHSIYNWAENMHYWKTDYQVPFPGAEGAAVHTGSARLLTAVCRL